MQLLFETIPEMFIREISLLAEDERLKYKTRRLEYVTHDGVLTRVEQFENACKINHLNYYFVFFIFLFFYFNLNIKKIF